MGVLFALALIVGALSLGSLPRVSLLEALTLVVLPSLAVWFFAPTNKRLKWCVAVGLLLAGFLLGALRAADALSSHEQRSVKHLELVETQLTLQDVPRVTAKGFVQPALLESGQLVQLFYKPAQAVDSKQTNSEFGDFAALSTQPTGANLNSELSNLQLSSPSISQNQNQNRNQQVYAKQGYTAGTVLSGVVRLSPTQTTKGLAVFNEQSYAFSRGFHGKASFVSKFEFKAAQQLTTLNWLDSKRYNYRMFMGMDQPTESKAVLLSLATGDRGWLETSTKRLYESMGISHLLAISGPHVLMVSLWVSWLLALLLNLTPWVYTKVSRHKLVVPVAAMVAVFYAGMTGFEPPALRTCLMFALVYLWSLRPSRVHLQKLLIGCAALMLMIWPSSVLDPGFWLSFAGAFALGWLSTFSSLDAKLLTQQQNKSKLKKLTNALKALVWVQLGIFVCLAPFTLFYFNALALHAPLINMVAIGFLGLLVVPLDLLGMLVHLFSPEAAKVLWGAALWLLDWFHAALKALQNLGLGLTGFRVGRSDWALVVLAGLCLVLPVKRFRLMGAAAVLILCMPVTPESKLWLQSSPSVAVSVFGDSTRYGAKAHVLVVSEFYQSSDAALDQSAKFLTALGAGTPNLIVIQDTLGFQNLSDQAVEQWLTSFKGASVLAAPSEHARLNRLMGGQIRLVSCQAGTSFEAGSVEVKAVSVWPELKLASEHQGCSVVVSGAHRVYYPGAASDLNLKLQHKLCSLGGKVDAVVFSQNLPLAAELKALVGSEALLIHQHPEAASTGTKGALHSAAGFQSDFKSNTDSDFDSDAGYVLAEKGASVLDLSALSLTKASLQGILQ